MFTQVAAKASLENYKKYKEGNRFVKTSNIIKQLIVIRLLPCNLTNNRIIIFSRKRLRVGKLSHQLKLQLNKRLIKNRHLSQGIGQQKLCEIQKTIAIKCTQYFLIETVKCYPSLEICSDKLIKKHPQWKESINVMG